MKPAPLTEEEIARRLPVWSALADTFLDTEFGDERYAAMAAQLARSGYEAEMLEWIYRNEVAPAFYPNLIDVAGEWAGWPDDYVRERVLEKRGSTLAKLGSRALLSDHINAQWERLHTAMEELGDAD